MAHFQDLNIIKYERTNMKYVLSEELMFLVCMYFLFEILLEYIREVRDTAKRKFRVFNRISDFTGKFALGIRT